MTRVGGAEDGAGDRAAGARLRRALEGIEIGDGGAALTFEARLARENGWSREFAGRVVGEYRRFLYLAAAGSGPATPSEAVDQAWHLHLCYTRSYWSDLCGGALGGRELHHEPTGGGEAEAGKYRAQYRSTLERYREAFGEEPPADIWPGVEERFAGAGRFQWVDVGRCWVISRAGARRAAAAAATGAVVLLVLAGCGLFSDGDGEGSGGPWIWLGAIGALVVLGIFASRPGKKGKRGPKSWWGGAGCGATGSDDGGGDSGCGSGCGGD